MERKDILKEAAEKGMLVVFNINTGVTDLVARLIIRKYGIEKTNVSVMSIRSKRIDWWDGADWVFAKPTKTQRLKAKVTGKSADGEYCRKILDRKGREFILVTPWLDWVAIGVEESRYCKEVVHIEEGNQSYLKVRCFDRDTITDRARLSLHKKGLIEDCYWDKRAKGFYALTREAFPEIGDEAKFVLGEESCIRSVYERKLNDDAVIGLVPGRQRYRESEFRDFIGYLAKDIGSNGFIKLHPALYREEVIVEMCHDVAKGISPGIGFLDNNVILEAEMTFSRLELRGAMSSLATYARILGSKFTEIRHEGYIKPNYAHIEARGK